MQQTICRMVSHNSETVDIRKINKVFEITTKSALGGVHRENVKILHVDFNMSVIFCPILKSVFHFYNPLAFYLD